MAKHGLCCSLYIDRGSHYFFTPRGRRHGVEDGGDAGTGFEPAWHRPYSGLLTAGSGLVLPHANIEAMNLHLQQISSQVSQGAFAVLTLDGAGWHRIGKRLVLPDNVGLLHLPPYSPELNPVENIWEFLRQNELSNRVFETYEAIVDACCVAWNKLIAAPERIRSIAMRDYAKTVGT